MDHTLVDDLLKALVGNLVVVDILKERERVDEALSIKVKVCSYQEQIQVAVEDMLVVGNLEQLGNPEEHSRAVVEGSLEKKCFIIEPLDKRSAKINYLVVVDLDIQD